MTLEQAKKEIVKRYRYLYENACFILAPFMCEQTIKESNFKGPLIYLNIEPFAKINFLFEEFLLSDKNSEDTALYKMVESKRNDKEYLEQVKTGLTLLEKDNKNKDNFKTNLDMWQILNATGNYIEEQASDLKNKERKLKVLDEYYRIARYKNNGKIYTSGRNLNLHDCNSLIIPIRKRKVFRDKKDIGITKNSFITTITNAPHYDDNSSIFTENEKQKIYLDYHDELPWDLEINCDIEEDNIVRLCRPKNTSPCKENFIIKEEEIFINPAETVNRYYQVCPHCGWIVNIPKEILSDGVKERIEDRCRKDENLFRKMFLYSELFSLEKHSYDSQRKLLKVESHDVK